MIEILAMKNRSAFILTFLLTLWTSVTQAGSIDGWGLFLDVGQLKPVNDDSGREYQDSKIIGDQIDYQFALGNSFSFSLFASENINRGVASKHKIWILQSRHPRCRISGMDGAIIYRCTWRAIFSDMD